MPISGVRIVSDPDIIKKRFRALLDGEKDEQILNFSGSAVKRDLVDHIEGQQEINDQAALKKNAASTLKRKLRKGQGFRSLIAEGNLVKNSTYRFNIEGGRGFIRRKKSIVTSKGSQDYEKIGAYVQRKGYLFWGISPRAQITIFRRYISFLRSLLK